MKPPNVPWRENEANYRRFQAEGKTADQIAAIFEVRPVALREVIKRYGWPKPRDPRHPTAEEEMAFAEAYDGGEAIHVLARKFGIQNKSVIYRARKLGLTGKRAGRGIVALHRRTGIGRARLLALLRHRALHAVSGPDDKHPDISYFIIEDDLIRFLKNPRYWHTWEVEKINDMALREWAAELRANNRVILTGDLKQRFHLSSTATAERWFVAGRVPGGQFCPITRRWHTRESELDHFVPPNERPLRTPSRHWTDDENRTLILERWRGQSFNEIARTMGRKETSVRARYQQEYLMGNLPIPAGLPDDVRIISPEEARRRRGPVVPSAPRTARTYTLLTPTQRADIYAAYTNGTRAKPLAMRYRVSMTTIKNVVVVEAKRHASELAAVG